MTGFSDLTITQDGDDTKIDLGENVGEIILENFTATDLDATDFDFAHDPVSPMIVTSGPLDFSTSAKMSARIFFIVRICFVLQSV